jgi:hypothetical protein
MTTPHDLTPHDDAPPVTADPVLDAALRRGASAPPAFAHDALHARIVAQAALPLAARRRTHKQRASTGVDALTDALAGWWKIALPMAAAAALAAMISVQRADGSIVVELEVRSSDSAALFGALSTDAETTLTDRVISRDGETLTLETDAP